MALGGPGASAVHERGRTTQPAPSSGLADLRISISCLIAGQVLDLWTTYEVLALGGREGNPISAFVLAWGGFVGLAAAKLAACTFFSVVAIVHWRRTSDYRSRLACRIACGIYVLVPWWNLWNLHRYGGA
jgi:hypothetical protein